MEDLVSEKTHLLNAIGNKVLHDNPQARIKYITAENFINEFVVHIRLDKMDELKLNTVIWTFS